MRGWMRCGARLCGGAVLGTISGCADVAAAPGAVAAPEPAAAAPTARNEPALLRAAAQLAPTQPPRARFANEGAEQPHADPTPREVVVVDEAGQPVPGAVVGTHLRLRSDGAVLADGPPSVTTDAAGRARVPLAAGDLVRAFAPGRRLVDAFAPASPEPWVIELPAALRIDVAIDGTVDFAGLHLRVELPPGCASGPFWQSKYVATPGCAVDGTVARWEQRGNRWDDRDPPRSLWELCPSPTGTAALDQLEVDGPVGVQLMRFGRVLETRVIDAAAANGRVALRFRTSSPAPLRGVVVDAVGRPLAAARLRMAPFGGPRIVDSPTNVAAFPVWAPEVEADPGGGYVLPRPDDPGERVVVTCAGHGARALTVAELEAAGGRIVLPPARTVRIEIVDCNGEPLDGGWTTSGREYAEPSVLLGHDVWRGTSDRELPWFEFAELPPGPVAFRCAGETLRHDATVPYARLVTAGPVESMGIGK